MKEINLKDVITDLKGDVVMMSPQDPTSLTIGKTIALIMQSYKGSRFNPVKLLDLALTFYQKDSIMLDDSDVAGVVEIVTGNAKEPTGFSCIVLGQVIKKLNQITDIADKKDKKDKID